MTTTAPPKIEGTADSGNEAKERVDRQEIMEQGAQMDSESARPTDETPYSRDIAEPESQTEKVEQAKENVKKMISDSRLASLAKARAAKAEKQKRLKAEGANAAKGTPAPDVLSALANKMEERFSSVMKRLDDFQTRIAHEAPLQAQHYIAPSSAEKPVDLEIHKETYVETKQGDSGVGRAYPTHEEPVGKHQPEYRPTKRTFDQAVEDEEGYHRRTKRAMDTMSFYNDRMQQRAMADPTQMGASAAAVKSSSDIFTMW